MEQNSYLPTTARMYREMKFIRVTYARRRLAAPVDTLRARNAREAKVSRIAAGILATMISRLSANAPDSRALRKLESG